MAEIRFNYGDKFTQPVNNNVGIGSTIPAAKLDVAGGASAGSLRVSGIATLSSYQGFVNTKLSIGLLKAYIEAAIPLWVLTSPEVVIVFTPFEKLVALLGIGNGSQRY